jgi:hypothetical protein
LKILVIRYKRLKKLIKGKVPKQTFIKGNGKMEKGQKNKWNMGTDLCEGNLNPQKPRHFFFRAAIFGVWHQNVFP